LYPVFHGLGLSLDPLHFNSMEDGFLHLSEAFFFEFLLKSLEFLVLFQSSLFQGGQFRVASSYLLFQICSDALFFLIKIDDIWMEGSNSSSRG
jgi:hypothetical protein